MHLAEAIAVYLAARRVELRSESLRTLAEDLKSIARFAGPDWPLSDLTAELLAAWIAEQAVAPATLQKRLSTVRVWCRWLVTRGHIAQDPTLLLPRVRRPRAVPRALSCEDVERLWAIPMPPRTRLCVSLMLFEGLRRGEIARLEWGDVRLGDMLLLVEGKGGHERVVPLSGTTAGLLRTHGARRAGPIVESESEPTRGVLGSRVSTLVRDVMRQAGLAESPHALRHTAATDALRSGCDIRTVQSFLGHASVMTTEIYLPWRVDALHPAVQNRAYAFVEA